MCRGRRVPPPLLPSAPYTGPLLLAGLLLPAVAAPAEPPPLLPAYAHNDYRNPRPLMDAIERRYRGVEADCFVIDGRLALAHERERADPGFTLREVYLDPLRRLVRERGSVYGDGIVFLLNIELKEEGETAYRALHETLHEYREILTTVENGTVRRGPVQVVLVGWHPSLEDLAARPVRHAAVQMHVEEMSGNHAGIPAHLLGMISLDFGKTFRWRGAGPPSRRIRERLAAAAAARDAVRGRVLRAHNVPVNARVYRTLLEAGFDLIGTRDLEKTARILDGIRE